MDLLLVSKSSHFQISKIIAQPGSVTFYKEAHSIIWDSITYLANNSYPIDVLTVTEHLRKTGKIEQVGGAY